MVRFPMPRRLALTAPAIVLASRAEAQQWPARPVRVVVTFSAGGAADTIARLLQPGMSQALGQPVMIENRPGAGGTLGAVAVSREAADGYTLLFDSAAHVVAPLLFRDLPIDYRTGFSYIGRATVQPYVWMVASSFPATTTQQFISVAKERPHPVTYGTPGTGSSGNIAAEAFAQAAGLTLEHVPYRGGAEAANAMAAGDLEAACITLSSAAPIAEAGRARLLGVTSAQRVASHPNVPALAEGGLPGFDITSWLGLFGPAGLPPAVIEKVAAALHAAATDPATVQRLAAAGFEASPSGPADFAAQVARDRQTFTTVIERTSLRSR